MIGAIAVPIIQQTVNDYAANISAVIFSFVFPTYNLSLCFTRLYNNEFGRRACVAVDCSVEFFKQNAKECCGSLDGNF